MGLRSRTKKKLDFIEVAGLRREMAEPSGLDLSSNDYLGLADDPRIKEALIEGVRLYGAGSTASRLLRGHRDIFERAEREFAKFKQTDRSLYFATGYQANVGALQTFLEPGDIVFSDELNHASLIDGVRLSKAEKLIFKHSDPDDLRSKLTSTKTEGEKFVITESLFSMDGDIPPLDEYAQICRENEANLIVDEAHAVGIYGENGSGLIREFGVEDDVFLSINTTGKALGLAGAFVAGPEWAIEYLIQRCRSFIFSTAPLPAIAHALVKSFAIIELEVDRRARLISICERFRELIREAGLPVAERATQIVPVVVGDADKAVEIAERLKRKGFDVRAIRPPTVPDGSSRLRVSLNTGLIDEDLRRIVSHLREAIDVEAGRGTTV